MFYCVFIFYGTSELPLGACTLNFFGAHNLARFRTTLDFDRKYIRNRLRYRKSEKQVINQKPSLVGRKKMGELWLTNKKSLVV